MQKESTLFGSFSPFTDSPSQPKRDAFSKWEQKESKFQARAEEVS